MQIDLETFKNIALSGIDSSEWKAVGWRSDVEIDYSHGGWFESFIVRHMPTGEYYSSPPLEMHHECSQEDEWPEPVTLTKVAKREVMVEMWVEVE